MTRLLEVTRRKNAGIRLNLCWILVLFALSCLCVPSAAQMTKEHLEALSNEELERICIERGLELVREVDGQPYEFSHDDYVEAARQCLAIEQEMNEILAEHPELAQELEAEVENMKAEQERLEQEQSRLMSEKEQLEEQIDRQTLPSDVPGTAAAFLPKVDVSEERVFEPKEVDDSKSESGEEDSSAATAAFIPKPDPANATETLDSSTTEQSQSLGQTEVESEQDKSTNASGPDQPSDPEETVGSTETQTDEEETASEVDDGDEEVLDLDGDEPISDSDKTEAPEEQVESSEDTGPVTLADILQEVLEQMKKDFKLVSAILGPVFRTIRDAGNFALRYIKALIVNIQDQKRSKDGAQIETARESQ